MKIITLTLNPAFDVHCSAPELTLYRENLATITSIEAGGKGINISRALIQNGVDNLAFLLVGEENGEDFLRMLSADGIPYRHLSVKGRIRENITCHTAGAPETRISFRGFSVDAPLWEQVKKTLLPLAEDGTVITLTGRLPSGPSMDAVKVLLGELSHRGARIVIDSRSFSLEDLRQVKPFLIKPNQEEISEYLGRQVSRFEEILSAAKDLHRDGIEHVMVSLGEGGAMLVCADGAFVATPPKIHALSTIGAGDSAIGGFLAAWSAGESSALCLRRTVAFGSAACLSEGTKPPRKEDVERLLPLITIRSLS